MKNAEKKPTGLGGKDYSALFRSGREPRKVTFTVEGKPCFVALRPLGKNDLTEYVMRTRATAANPAALEAGGETINFLVGKTLVDCCLWTRPTLKGGTLGELQQMMPPEGAKDLVEWVGAQFDALAEFWNDLVEECMLENQLLEPEPDEGNSPAPSAK